jgi:hypothetical protein
VHAFGDVGAGMHQSGSWAIGLPELLTVHTGFQLMGWSAAFTLRPVRYKG